MSAVMLDQRVEILKWFAMQDAITQMEILAAKHEIFISKLKEKKVDDKSLLELRCLIFVARQGWQAEQNCKKGKAISENEAAQISVRRRRRAREPASFTQVLSQRQGGQKCLRERRVARNRPRKTDARASQ